jgi:hypothetical protein
MLAFMGMAPVGSLLAGLASRALGTPVTVLFGGSICLLAGLVFALRPLLTLPSPTRR